MSWQLFLEERWNVQVRHLPPFSNYFPCFPPLHLEARRELGELESMVGESNAGARGGPLAVSWEIPEPGYLDGGIREATS